jgi:hypothetical protein
MPSRPVAHGVAVAVRIGQRPQVPAIAPAPEVVRVAAAGRIVEARGLLVEDVVVSVAVPHLVRPGALQKVRCRVAGHPSIAPHLVEHVGASVRGDVALSVERAVPARLDRSERKIPADPERGVPDEGPVDEARLRRRSLRRRRRAVIVDARVVEQRQLQPQLRPDGIGRAERDRERELTVVEIDRVEVFAVEHIRGEAGRRVGIVVGSVLSRQVAGCGQQGAQGEPRGKSFCRHRHSSREELAGDVLAS